MSVAKKTYTTHHHKHKTENITNNYVEYHTHIYEYETIVQRIKRYLKEKR